MPLAVLTLNIGFPPSTARDTSCSGLPTATTTSSSSGNQETRQLGIPCSVAASVTDTTAPPSSRGVLPRM
jgi:hypothetical protein